MSMSQMKKKRKRERYGGFYRTGVGGTTSNYGGVQSRMGSGRGKARSARILEDVGVIISDSSCLSSFLSSTSRMKEVSAVKKVLLVEDDSRPLLGRTSSSWVNREEGEDDTMDVSIEDVLVAIEDIPPLALDRGVRSD